MKLHTPILVVFAIVVALWFVAGPLSYISQPDSLASANNAAVVATSVTVSIPAKGATKQVTLTKTKLLALADALYQDGQVPLGDYRYSTTVAKKGSIYLCNARKNDPGSRVIGPWIEGDSWNFMRKIEISGSVSWKEAKFSNVVSGSTRTLSGNALPISHTTGIFPVARNDSAAEYDPNPNTISAQSITQKLPVDPVYSMTPYCMGGEAGIMLSGVPLFNAFDAGLRDAPAHELQDSCDGHPQGSGEYHYHSLSSCFKDAGVETVLGYAYDGFPITGGKVAEGKYLTTDDLDECHGITSEVIIDGKKKTTYHYVMTVDFPYSASCFRAKPVTTGPSVAPNSGQQGGQQAARPQGGQPAQAGTPPQEAMRACSSSIMNASCSFTTPRGDTVSGTCGAPPGATKLACMPQRQGE
ncbi:MAG: YHYH protein [Candidatus Pacebacteria bacterium]|nr:YHYH protein [Candidatus Paceibacterota bacterium]